MDSRPSGRRAASGAGGHIVAENLNALNFSVQYPLAPRRTALSGGVGVRGAAFGFVALCGTVPPA